MMVSTQQMVDTLLSGMQNQQQTVSTATDQLSSGQRFTTADQNPVAYEKSLSMRDLQSSIKGSMTALDTATTQLGMKQSAMSQMIPLLQRSQVLATQMASGNNGPNNYPATLAEVKSLQQQFLTFANQTWQGQALFAGTDTSVPSTFTLDAAGNATYNGNTQDQSTVITPTQSVDLGANGSDAAFTQAFAAFKNFSDALSTGNAAGIQSAISDFTNASNSMTDLTAQIGGTLSSASMQKSTYQNLQTQVASSLSKNESADVAAAATKLQQANIALQAIYSEIAKLGNISLVNYLK